MSTVPELLDRAAGSSDAGIRFLDRDEHETWFGWSEIREYARRVAGGLRDAGIRRGERVALVYPTGVDFVTGLFGTLLAGAVPVPLYPPVRLGRLGEYVDLTAHMMRMADARLVLLDRRVQRVFGGVLDRSRPALGAWQVDRIADGQSFQSDAVDPDDLALVQFSSGSTRRPEPVALSHRAVLAQARILNGFWPDTDDVRHTGLSWLPLYHDMGLIGCVFPALERPSTLTLIGPEAFVARPAIWLRALSRYRATISPAPNFAYALATERIRDEDLAGVDLSSWRVAPNGAEPISPEVIRAFEGRFSRWGLRNDTITPVYGLSEAALAVTFSNTGQPFRTRCFDRDALVGGRRAVPSADGIEMVSVGRPIPGFEIRIVDRAGDRLDDGRIGTIQVRGPSLMAGYLRADGSLDRRFRDGWLDTGDLGFVHDGELFLAGRAKDVVILRGRNYDPSLFESAAGDVPGVRPDRIVSLGRLPEGSTREELWLFVEPRRRLEPGARAALPERCRRAVVEATGVLPDRVVVVDPGALPRTSSGKIRRRETARRYDGGSLTAPGVLARARVVGEWLRSAFVRSPARRSAAE